MHSDKKARKKEADREKKTNSVLENFSMEQDSDHRKKNEFLWSAIVNRNHNAEGGGGM